MPEASETAAGRRPWKQLASDGSERLLAHKGVAGSQFLLFVHITAVNSQTCTYTRDTFGNTSFPGVWIEHTDVLNSPAHLSCNPETIPSDNRLHAFPGQRLNTYFAFWRSSQSATSPLPIAVVIIFYSQACAFSTALLPLVDEVAQHYSKQSIKLLRVDTAHLAYSDMIKMGITTTPVIRLHTQVDRQSMYAAQTHNIKLRK
ncbi:hypothetical protein ABBQ38_014641 [Trebouxia sp. C0009 RCD-2024]